jgi:putative addiction module component (TIGR02574 family)
MSTAQEIRELALGLPLQARASLARDLLESLEPNGITEDVERAWSDEIESRAEAFEAGKLAADDWETSLKRARQRLREGPRA